MIETLIEEVRKGNAQQLIIIERLTLLTQALQCRSQVTRPPTILKSLSRDDRAKSIALLPAVWTLCQEEHWTVVHLLRVAALPGADSAKLATAIELAWSQTSKAPLVAFGKFLSKIAGHDFNGYQLRRVGGLDRDGTTWQLQRK